MRSEQRRYISYLLRLWQIKSEGELIWRVSLESPRTRQRQGFASLEALVGFLREEVDLSPDSTHGPVEGS